MLQSHKRRGLAKQAPLLASDSLLKFTQLATLTSPFSNATITPSYGSLLASAQLIAANYPLTASITEVTTLASGRKIFCLRVNDDGHKPVVIVTNGIHGDEVATGAGAIHIASLLAAGTAQEILTPALSNLALCIVVDVNPDGTATVTRNNSNNKNLNRNFPWFFASCEDTDKGTTALDQPETSGITSYLISSGILPRVVLACDLHGWTSSTTWGFLSEQIFYDNFSEQTQRASYHYIQELLRVRSWAGFTIVNATPALTEYRSRYRPYINTYLRNGGQLSATSFLIEYPMTENAGVAGTVGLDVTLGALAAALDLIAAKRYSLSASHPASSTVNTNSDFALWHATLPRPQYITYTRAAYVSNTPAKHDLVIKPYVFDEWPKAITSAGYCTASLTGTDYSIYIAAGQSPSGSVSYTAYETPTIPAKAGSAYPKVVKFNALCSDGSTVMYGYGGVDTATSYQSGLYKCTFPTGAWTLQVSAVKYESVPASGTFDTVLALQRHTMHLYGGFIYIVGGRTSAAVSASVWKVDPANGHATLFATLPAATQRHTSCISGTNLYVFGGDAGATCRNTIYKVTLGGAVVTTLAAVLPAIRNCQAIAQSATAAYLTGGSNLVTPVVAGDYASNIYKFAFSGETITTVAYSLDSYINDEGTTVSIEAPAATGQAAYVTEDDDALVIIGGNLFTGITTGVWTLDLSTLVLTRRRAQAGIHSYLRSSQAFTTVVGESYSLVLHISNPNPVNHTASVHVCPVIIIGPLSAPLRVIDTMRFVPPRGESVISIPVRIRVGEDGASMIRAYLRFWGGDQKIRITDLALLKLTNSNYSTGHSIVSAAQAATTITQAVSIDSTIAASISGIFLPTWGSKSGVDLEVITFGVINTAIVGSLDSMSLWFTATDVDTPAAEGTFKLKWDVGAGVQTYVFPVLELNHSKTATHWRKDRVHWKLTSTGVGYTLSIWFYGRLLTKTITCAQSALNNYAYVGSGVLASPL